MNLAFEVLTRAGGLALAASLTVACKPTSAPVASPTPATPATTATPAIAQPGSSAAAPASSASSVGTPAAARVEHVKVTILSTMLADRGIGEWGFSALVEADGHRILFDTGLRRDTVLDNAKTLQIDLSTIDSVVLSHHHNDHVGGLLPLRHAVADQAPDALATVHVARGMFLSRRYGERPREVNAMLAARTEYEATGGRFVVHDAATQIFPGVWVTGPVPRVHPEHNWTPARQMHTEHGWVEDTLPESQSLVIDTADGLLVLSGCGHAGIINTIAHARDVVRPAPVYAAIGGFHLLDADQQQLQWTADHLQTFEVAHFFGAHCTGLEPVYRFRELLALPRSASVVAAVGASFETGSGIDSRALAR